MTKEKLYELGVKLAERFCSANQIPMPSIRRLTLMDPAYHLRTCAFYRPTTICIMVEKCANPGHAGRAWSWPAYAVDRTPYGVIQHELGHHVDHIRSPHPKTEIFSKRMLDCSGEPPLTGYLGTDKRAITFHMEWFAENFRLFVTNPNLCCRLRPLFFEAMTEANFQPVFEEGWAEVLYMHAAPERITNMAEKKIKMVELEGDIEEEERQEQEKFDL